MIMRNKNSGDRADRGVALLIVLVVTALLIALIFEFAYATRVSLRAAVNFRDSQRAYFLARSGVNFVGMILSDNKKNNKLQDNLEQKEWQVAPIISGGDTELRVRWEDERGKINVSTVREGNDAYNRLVQLFTEKEISQDILNRISEEKMTFRLLTELHQVVGDEDFGKVEKFLTVNSDGKIDINTAPEEVLKSLRIDPSVILSQRSAGPITNLNNVSGIDTVKSSLDVTSDIFKVYSHATVGNYTKQVEAVIQRSASGFSILYWRAL